MPPVPAVPEQLQLQRDFLDHHLKGVDNGVDAWPVVRYHELGSEVLRESATWPPEGTRRERLHPTAARGLAPEPEEVAAVLAYEADLELGSGRESLDACADRNLVRV